MADRETLLKILDLARWAPSGDNTQPWRFEIVSGDHVAIHGNDTREWCLYDFDGHASHMAHGALLETLRIAATGFHLRTEWVRRVGTPDDAPIFDVRLREDADLAADPLLASVETRSVQRRRMKTTPLTDVQRAALRAAPGVGYKVKLLESFGERSRTARLLWDSAYIRLTCPEAFEVHRSIIEWGARYSKDRIPVEAVGVDPVTAKLMPWAMASWERMHFLNRYLMATVPPRIMLDALPALRCAAHVLLVAERPLLTVEDYVHCGAAMQRLWLTATSVGLHLQPEMTPLIFRWYARHGRQFSASENLAAASRKLSEDFEMLSGEQASVDFGFFCRVGRSEAPRSRSLRLELEELMVRS